MRVLVSSIVDLRRSANNRLHHLLRGIADRHEVTVYSITDWWKESQVDPSLYNRGFEDVLDKIEIRPIVRRRIPPVAQEFLSPALADRSKIKAVSPDVVFDYNTLVSGRALWGRMARDGVPVVYDVADDLVAMVGASPQIPRIMRPVAQGAAGRAFRRTLAMATSVTATTRNLVPEGSVHRNTTTVIANGVDTKAFQPKGKVKDLPAGGGDDIVLGYVGVLREWVDFTPVLEGMASFLETKGASDPGVRLVIVGAEGKMAPSIKAKAKEVGVDQRVHFEGTVRYGDVPGYMRAFDAGVIPFDASEISVNAVPLKMFEYMAVGLPVIASPLAGIQEAAGDRVRYAATAMDYAGLIADLRHRREAERGNLDWVRKNHSWESVRRHFASVIENAGGC